VTPPTALPQLDLSQSKRPELLAPAGDRDCIRAAIENGADAVYFGLDTGFNARARAKNFSPEDLPEIMALLHRRGLKGYVTVNTLVFSSELETLEQHIRQIAAASVDAVLVQDLGVVRMIREICPDLPIHASTQMTLTSAECIAVAASLGVERVVLARELSIGEIRKIRKKTQMPLEVFVHGALCVAYSGQCLTSESLGGRSANRGQCAQACRLPYDLVCDGKEVDLGDQKYLLSPQDLAAYALIPELIEAGICSFKIEGRLKTPEYVANITRHYRQAIDSALAGKPVQFTPRQVEEMELSFSRGFSPGWLKGDDHKMLVPAISSSKRGVLMGTVREVRKGRVVVELASSVKRGDGVSFDCERPEDDLQGGRVYQVYQKGHDLTEPVSKGVVELAFAHGGLNFDEIWPGQQIWKTDDPELTARLRKTFTGTEPLRKLNLEIAARAPVDEPLTLEVAVADHGVRFSLVTSEPLAKARQHPLTVEVLKEQLGRLGGTPYELRNLAASITGEPMLPFSVLGKLRHEMVERLDAALAAPPERRIENESVLARLRSRGIEAAASSVQASSSPQIHVLCRSLPQLKEVLELGIRSLYADFQDIREYRPAVAMAKEHGATLFLATPRIQKPDEVGIFLALAKHAANGILVRNLAGLAFYAERQFPIVADFSLNCTSELTARFLREQGARRITPSYDLNREQLLDLVSGVAAASMDVACLEVVVHQHMPMFHMEHCVFCSVLSPGTNKTNCGRPCDTHDVKLRDRLQIEHPLKADVGCRNTLFNAVPQSGAEVVPSLLAHGVKHFRLELLDQRRAELRQILDLYQQLLAGTVKGKEVWTRLQASNRVGVTRGTLEERRNPLAML
jgi:U32 family peptidase